MCAYFGFFIGLPLLTGDFFTIDEDKFEWDLTLDCIGTKDLVELGFMALSDMEDVLFLFERFSFSITVLFNLEDVGVVPGKMNDLLFFDGWSDRNIDGRVVDG